MRLLFSRGKPLFYADGKANPGTDLTFFDFPAAPEQRGTNSISRTGLRVNLMVFTGAFLLLFTATMGVLMLRLLHLPAKLVPPEQKAQHEVVATLCLLAMFSPGNFFWIAAVLVAMTDNPDFTPLLQRIAEAVRRIAQSPKAKEEVRSPAQNHRDH